MQSQVALQDSRAWEALAAEMGETMKQDLKLAPWKLELRRRLAEQVALITSIPEKAAERVEKFALEAVTSSTRAKEVQREIMRTGKVAAGRARTIARTTVGTVGSLVTEVRATHIGCEGYFWRSSEDADVRKEHRKLNGKFIKYSEPPIVDEASGRRAHAGQDINCRCYQEPALPEMKEAA
jgi:SPP1 gp7 family putative phage head morphogenesis protein